VRASRWRGLTSAVACCRVAPSSERGWLESPGGGTRRTRVTRAVPAPASTRRQRPSPEIPDSIRSTPSERARDYGASCLRPAPIRAIHLCRQGVVRHGGDLTIGFVARHRRLAAIGTIALRECDRRAGGAVRRRRTAEFGRSHTPARPSDRPGRAYATRPHGWSASRFRIAGEAGNRPQGVGTAAGCRPTHKPVSAARRPAAGPEPRYLSRSARSATLAAGAGSLPYAWRSERGSGLPRKRRWRWLPER
jgi:hypothetical protein